MFYRPGPARAFLLLITAFSLPAPSAASSPDELPLALCFAPGTPRERVEAEYRRAQARYPVSLRDASGWRYQLNSRWTTAATAHGSYSQGSPLALTWSVVPDNTPIDGWNGEPAAGSNLRARLAAIYGSFEAGRLVIQQVFDHLEELTGVDYVYEPNDDGAGLTSAALPGGALGVRGDVRLSGHTIDGNYGVLAYNFYPNVGEMVLDTADVFFNSTSSDSLGLRNVLAHEFGHGLGLRHVCPINQTKLMEPFVTFAFDGLQHDDLLALNRHYGDWRENNDTTAAPAALGPLGASATLDNLSIDDNADNDVFSFGVSAGGAISATVTPLGSTYLNGAQNGDGSCSAGTNYDSLAQHDLAFDILGSDGATVLASADATGAGAAESLGLVNLPAAGTYYVEVRGGVTDSAQLYRLELVGTPNLFADDFESADDSRWSFSFQ